MVAGNTSALARHAQRLVWLALIICTSGPLATVLCGDDTSATSEQPRQVDAYVEAELRRLTAAETDLDSKSSFGCQSTEAQASNLHKYMDDLASSLDEGVSNNSKDAQTFKQELAQAINLHEILPGAPALGPHKPAMSAGAAAAGLGQLLLSDSGAGKNNHIVHADKSLSDTGIQELADFAQRGALARGRYALAQMFLASAASDKGAANKHLRLLTLGDIVEGERRAQELELWRAQGGQLGAASRAVAGSARVLFNMMSAGMLFIDQLYVSSEFLESMPFIASGISALRAKGKPVHDIIQTVRSLQSMIDYSSLERIEPNASPMTKARVLISASGMKALTGVASKLMQPYVKAILTPGDSSSSSQNGSARNEIARRVAYYLLVQFAPKSLMCQLTT